MAIRLNGGLSLAPTQTRRIAGKSYSIPLVMEKPATKADIRTAKKTYKSPTSNKIQPIDPLSLVGFGAPGGLSPTGVIDLWQLAFGSADTQQKISLGMVGGATPYVEPFGIVPTGTTTAVLDVPVVDFPGSDIPGLPALDYILPGAGDVIGKFEFPKLPSLDDLKMPLLIAGGAIAGLFLLGKYIGRSKK